MLLGFCCAAGGESEAALKNVQAIDGMFTIVFISIKYSRYRKFTFCMYNPTGNDKDRENAFQALASGYGFACFCYIVAFIIATCTKE